MTGEEEVGLETMVDYSWLRHLSIKRKMAIHLIV